MSPETSIAGIRLLHPIMNAAGTCKSREDVSRLARSASAAIMVGSITMEPREGNKGENFVADEFLYSLNSLGLPNFGAVYYKKILPFMVSEAHDKGQPLFVSVAGFSVEEYAELASLAFEGGADLVELNLGCPNVWQGNVQKRIVCFSPSMVAEILSAVEEKVGAEAKVSVKLSPFSDPWLLAEVALVVGASALVKAVTAVNSFPNAFASQGGRTRITRIKFGNGLAGFAGHALKPIGLGQVQQLRECLPARIQIIGVGGVSTGTDVWEYLDRGSVAVQVATFYLTRGERVFSSLLAEFIDLAM